MEQKGIFILKRKEICYNDRYRKIGDNNIPDTD